MGRIVAYFPNLVSQALFVSYDEEVTFGLSTILPQPQLLVDCFAKEVSEVYARAA